MEVSQGRCMESYLSEEETKVPSKPVKRSFDVAFLMAPDDPKKKDDVRVAGEGSAFTKVSRLEEPTKGGFLYQSSPEYRKEEKKRIYPEVAGYAGIPYPTFPPTALLPALLPPALAALSPLTQNICAKCNISFRMTSDLVYHMRSHHKNESSGSDSARRRREQEKLRCPVCNESFRERHHLTRHMTAHQDKEGDTPDLDLPRSRRIK